MFSNSNDAPSENSGSGGQVGGMFSNSGDAPSKAPVNPNRQNAEAGMFSNQSDSAQPDAYGGAQREQGMGPMDPNLGDGEGNYEGEGKKKHGIMGKIKEAFVPKPNAPGRVQNDDLVSFEREREGGDVTDGYRMLVMLLLFSLEGIVGGMSRRIGI